MINRKFLGPVTTHALASEMAKQAAMAGIRGVTVRPVAGGFRAVAETKADLGAAASREFGGSVARERVTSDDEQFDLEVATSWKQAELLDEMTDRERELGQQLGSDSLGKKTRHVRHFPSWYEAREFVRELEAAGVSKRSIFRDQATVEWTGYTGFASGAAVRAAIEEGRLARPEHRTGLGDTGSVALPKLAGQVEKTFATVKLAQWHARLLRKNGARNVKQSGFTVRWDV